MIFVWSPMYFCGLRGLNVPEYAINTMYNLFYKKKIMATNSSNVNYANGSDLASDATTTSFWDSLANGPLGDLVKPKYNYNLLQYPADLNSSGKGHSVVFNMFTTTSIISEGQTVFSALKNEYTKLEGEVKNVVGDPNLKNLDATGQKVIAAVSKSIAEFNPSRKEMESKVTLYMPETMSFQYSSSYDGSTTLTSVLTSAPLIGGVAEYIAGKASAGTDFKKLAMQKAGFAFNPQAQMLFDGIDFRTYSMSFTFTPRSSKEADQVQKIIKTFKTFAAPKIVTEAGGFFFRPPGIFQIDFMFRDKINPNVNKVTDSVLLDVDVNYAPNGWSAHNDGHPTQIQMTLNFKEIELVDRNKIDAGY